MDAILIRPNGGKSYTDILRSMKADPRFAEVPVVWLLRRTLQGDVLIKIKRDEPFITKLRTLLTDMLGEIATFDRLESMAPLEVGDFEETARWDEVASALKMYHPGIVETIRSHVIRQGYRGVQTTIAVWVAS